MAYIKKEEKSLTLHQNKVVKETQNPELAEGNNKNWLKLMNQKQKIGKANKIKKKNRKGEGGSFKRETKLINL